MTSDTRLLQSISLAVAQARKVDDVLTMIVEGLVEKAGYALTRIWLLPSPSSTPNAADSAQKILQLAASAGKSKVNGELWNRLDGAFSQIPLGTRKIGQIAQRGKSVHLDGPQLTRSENVARPEWIAREGIKGFAGHPLIFRDEILGVLAIFSREPIADEEFEWLRLFADHGAVAIANARAFEEIENLRHRLELENEYLRDEVKENFGGLVGQSPRLRKVLQQIELVAPLDTNVLVLGESGTGKELIARAIHERSRRSQRALVKVNCASVPHDLFESEFFGHVKGAFTGALRDRAGRFQLADGGTLFLDEIGEIPPALQSKLLRVIQEGEFERLGDERTQRVDVRVIAATNRDLEEEVKAGRFRQDLYFRLSVFPLEAPPLRERREDIPLLAAHFLKMAATRMSVPLPRLTHANVQQLTEYPWPGNVRELQNVIERAVIIARGGPLVFDLREAASVDAPASPATQKQWLESQRPVIEGALRQSGGKIYGAGGAAERLGLRPTTLASRMAALGIKKR